jgi:DegV family protein with EDD domain
MARGYIKIADIRKDLYKMKQACDLLKTTPRTLRYYEHIGLLPKATRTRGQMRMYLQKDIDLIKKVQEYQTQGYSLLNIKELFIKKGWLYTEIKKIKLIIDSTFVVDHQAAFAEDITIMPMNIHFGVRRYQDFMSLSPENFYELEQKKRVLATTSAPKIEEYIKVFSEAVSQGYQKVVSLHPDARIVSSFEIAKQAAKELSALNIEVIDTKLLSLGFYHVFQEILSKKPDNIKTIRTIIAESREKVSEVIIINSKERFSKQGNNPLAEMLADFVPVLQHTALSGLVPVYRANNLKEALAYVKKNLQSRKKIKCAYSHKDMLKQLKLWPNIDGCCQYSSVMMANLGRELLGFSFSKPLL